MNQEELSFESIQLIRAGFPDCSVRVRQHQRGKEKFRYLKLEFEYEAASYIHHGHHTSPEASTCELIVCWTDNLTDRSTLPPAIREVLPSVLALSEVVQTGNLKIKRSCC